MNINNLNVDTQAIANGLYQIICEKGEEAIVAFGMIPKWIIDMTEKQLREKIIAEAAKQVACTPDDLKPVLDKAIIDNMVNKIMREISTGIYRAASDAGMMRV